VTGSSSGQASHSSAILPLLPPLLLSHVQHLPCRFGTRILPTMWSSLRCLARVGLMWLVLASVTHASPLDESTATRCVDCRAPLPSAHTFLRTLLRSFLPSLCGRIGGSRDGSQEPRLCAVSWHDVDQSIFTKPMLVQVDASDAGVDHVVMYQSRAEVTRPVRSRGLGLCARLRGFVVPVAAVRLCCSHKGGASLNSVGANSGPLGAVGVRGARPRSV